MLFPVKCCVLKNNNHQAFSLKILGLPIDPQQGSQGFEKQKIQK